MVKSICPVLLLLLLFGCSGGTMEKGSSSPKATTCEGVAEDFGAAMQEQDYRRAYDYTLPGYQTSVSFATFVEKHQTLHEKAGKPSKWGISEVGYFHTDDQRGVGIDFGNNRENGEVIPVYVCILMFSEKNNVCKVESVDCEMEESGEGEKEEDSDSEG